MNQNEAGNSPYYKNVSNGASYFSNLSLEKVVGKVF